MCLWLLSELFGQSRWRFMSQKTKKY
jgi:hypothetical protein